MTVDAQRRAMPEEEWTVRRVLDWTTAHLKKHGSETPRLDAEILLAHARGCKRIDLYTRYDEPLREQERSAMRELVSRRARAEPVAYLVGHREFFGLPFRVTSDVLIPRPDTETLVVELLAIARALSAPRILDVGTGSGCIAVCAAVNHQGARVTAVDLSPAALDVARENAERHDVAGRIRFVQGDLFGPLGADERFDVIASNPPYVCEDEMGTLPPDVRLHEPASALVAGADGLDVIRRLIADAPGGLAAGGRLLIEMSPEQAGEIQQAAEARGAYDDIRFLRDLGSQRRVLHARAR